MLIIEIITVLKRTVCGAEKEKIRKCKWVRGGVSFVNVGDKRTTKARLLFFQGSQMIITVISISHKKRKLDGVCDPIQTGSSFYWLIPYYSAWWSWKKREHGKRKKIVINWPIFFMMPVAHTFGEKKVPRHKLSTGRIIIMLLCKHAGLGMPAKQFSVSVSDHFLYKNI